MSNLKPCPFCGREPMYYKSFSKVTIGCRSADCHVNPTLSVGKRENPEAKWNERVCDSNHDRLVEENAELREMLKKFIPSNDYYETNEDDEDVYFNHGGTFEYNEDSEHIGIEVVKLLNK